MVGGSMEHHYVVYLTIVLVSLWGGLVSYVLDRENEHSKACPGGFWSHLIVASFTGSVSGLICLDAGLTLLTMIAVSAVASSIGVPLLHSLQVRILTLLCDSRPSPHHDGK